MALYGHSSLLEEGEVVEMTKEQLKPFVELMAYADLSKGTDAQRKAFTESTVAQVLVEKQVLTKPTMMRLSKEDDAKRRIKLAAYKLAKDANDSDYKKMQAYRKQWRKYRAKVMKKYAAKATRISRISQQEYIKNARKTQA